MTKRHFKGDLCTLNHLVITAEGAGLAEDCQDGVVCSVLYGAGNIGLGMRDIVKEVELQFGLTEFPLQIVRNTVSRLQQKGQLRKKGELFFLEDEKLDKIAHEIAKMNDALSRAESKIVAEVNKKTQDDPKASKAAKEALQKFLTLYCNEETRYAQNLLSFTPATTRLKSPREIFDESLEGIDDPNIKKAIKDAIEKTFKAPNKKLEKYLYKTVANCMHLRFLKADPEMTGIRRSALSVKTFILDTNVLITLVLKEHPKQATTSRIVSLMKDLNQGLRFTNRTWQEWLEVLEKANQRYKFINTTRPSLLGRLDDIFVQEFLQKSQKNLSLTWQDYYSEMRHLELLAGKEGIRLLDKDPHELDELIDQELLSKLSNQVFRSGKRRLDMKFIKSKQVSQHDAYHLLLIRKLRERHPTETLGPSYWFLTQDPSLLEVDKALNELLQDSSALPSSLTFDVWTLMASPFLASDSHRVRLAKVLVELLRVNLAEAPIGQSASKIIEVLSPWLSYKSLSDKDLETILGDENVTRIYNKLREAGSTDPEKTREISEQLRKHVTKEAWDLLERKVQEAEESNVK
jgi:predicted nucleic acid-binding protein